jgi:hypothetical protein
MKKISKLKILVTSLFSLGLMGCIESDSGAGTSATTLSFPSSSTLADPTLANGEKVGQSVATNKVKSAINLNSINSGSNIDFIPFYKNLFEKASVSVVTSNDYVLNKTIDETIDCGSKGTDGTYTIKGTDNKVFKSATITYNNCTTNNDDNTLNGTIKITASNYDTVESKYKKGTINFLSDFTSGKAKIYKNSSISISYNSIAGDSEKYMMTLSTKATDGTNYNGMNNCVFYFGLSSSGNATMYQTQGDIYINNLASYVSYDTSYDMSKTPFRYDRNDGTAKSIGGTAIYIMQSKAKLKVSQTDGGVVVSIDTNGDGIYDLI